MNSRTRSSHSDLNMRTIFILLTMFNYSVALFSKNISGRISDNNAQTPTSFVNIGV
ncbi:hypothetical protein JCM21142_104149 [Saccharicrinis fermentans DSM 9555 = JCM 21142]|uniref:Uncharacterized protein n=1 Tax=Saccharicrinis fermentans DSM 9555 = JCM 21142 TaxID=869213 RepID=W7Y3H4_9BACT|nr:hypothetical protein JCM21142_104149 [Saccharicrinis fermentans DSM 9555 = JCM 21142]